MAALVISSDLNKHTEAAMKVEITVKIDGELIKEHIEQVDGTLEQMEEKIHALGKQVACEALQASVDAMPSPRPLFRRRTDGLVTRDTRRGPCSG
jgi:uncharacterized membrane protein YcaP (DUF421 family)